MPVSALVLAYGVHLMSSSTRSSFFCSRFDRAAWVGFLQWLGVFLDAAIAVLLLRILAWSRTTKSRLRTLGTILLLAALGMGIVLAVTELYHPSGPAGRYALARGLDSLYAFDVSIDSFMISVFVISACLFGCESGPSSLVIPLSFLCGMLAAAHKVFGIGDFPLVTKSGILLPLYTICVGFSVVLWLHQVRSVGFVERTFILLFMAAFILAATMIAIFSSQTVDRHPLQSIIYDVRVEHDRWLMQAAISKSLPVAVGEYRERNHGRDPPLGFDEWYKFAVDQKSVIIDHFEQIERDLLPFWGLKPAQIRENLKRVFTEPDIAVLTIRGGVATHNQTAEHPDRLSLNGMVEMINSFASHLPDMELAVNLARSPRVLVPWDELHGLTETGTHVRSKGSNGKLAGLESPKGLQQERLDDLTRSTTADQKGLLSVHQFRQMNAITCPPGSATRSGVHWNTRDLCTGCARPHSEGQYLRDWQRSTDICHQSDILRLHGFYFTSPAHVPLQDLMPVFSRSKTAGFNDILIPLPRPKDSQAVDMGEEYMMKDGRLSWRGKIEQPGLSHGLHHGGHQERLAHLVNNASASDRITLMLPLPNTKGRWAYEQAKTYEANTALPFDLGIGEITACISPDTSADCNIAKAEFGRTAETNVLSNRYVLLTDTDTGPSPDILPALKSTSIPFVASIFREWYSERLSPWLHFVPVDLRYQALHSTLAYFTGLRGNGVVNGRDPEMDAAEDDARWIAEQGSKWASRAVRKEDAEVYLFRLLLEWWRISDDRRDDLGFRLDGET